MMLNKLKKYFHENQDLILSAFAASDPTGNGWRTWYLTHYGEAR